VPGAMKSVGLAVLLATVAALSCKAAGVVANPDSSPDVTAPEAPSTTPVTEPGVNPANPLPPLTAPVEDIFERKYWYLVLLDAKEVFTSPLRWDSRDWLTLGGMSAGIGVVAVFDQKIERAIRSGRSDAMTTVLDNVQPLGNEYAIGIVGSFYLAGEVFKDARAKATALDGIAASGIASGLIVNSVKYVVGRARPTDGRGAYSFQPFSGKDSFMSGHTTEAFTLASVISEHYQEPWIEISAYGLAGTVGYARLNNNRHWPSDVLAGAVVGTFVGKTVVRFNQEHRKISIEPILSADTRGAELALPW